MLKKKKDPHFTDEALKPRKIQAHSAFQVLTDYVYLMLAVPESELKCSHTSLGSQNRDASTGVAL